MRAASRLATAASQALKQKSAGELALVVEAEMLHKADGLYATTDPWKYHTGDKVDTLTATAVHS